MARLYRNVLFLNDFCHLSTYLQHVHASGIGLHVKLELSVLGHATPNLLTHSIEQ